ncbi:MAG: cyclic nucleotide-binding domain-containing protein [Bacteroidota bacterium]
MKTYDLDILAAYFHSTVGVPPEKFARIRHLFQLEHYPKGEFLVRQEEHAQKMWFLLEGYIRCYAEAKDKEITHWVYWPHRLVTDIPSFNRQGPSHWHFQTISDCAAFALTYEQYQEAQRIVPDWHVYENRILVKFFMSLEHRIYTFISMNATERYQYLHDAHPELFNQIPLIYLSSLLNMAPETISRIRRKTIS